MNSKFVEGYNFLFYVLTFGAIAASISYAFRNVRGAYGLYVLDDARAPIFFIGAFLTACALLVFILRTIGPVGFSAAEIFWKFSGQLQLPVSAWRSSLTWAVLVLWGLCVVLLATVFAPLSTVWMLGACACALVTAFMLVEWTRATQLTHRFHWVSLWATIIACVGIAITVIGTLHSLPAVPLKPVIVLAVSCLSSGFMLMLRDYLMSRKQVMAWEDATQGSGRRAVLLGALSNVGAPHGYKYYGAQGRSHSLTTVSFLHLSISSVLTTPVPLFGTIALSLPLGIFLGTSVGTLGVGIVVVAGCWVLGSAYRWLAREWSAQASLRLWIGGRYLLTLFYLCIGPGIMVLVYLIAIALIFSLPLSVALAGFLFGFFIAMGEPNPPAHFNYELAITTAEGLMIPVEPVKWLITNVAALVLAGVALFAGATPSVLIIGGMLVTRILGHWRYQRRR